MLQRFHATAGGDDASGRPGCKHCVIWRLNQADGVFRVGAADHSMLRRWPAAERLANQWKCGKILAFRFLGLQSLSENSAAAR
jgi:hypothetical protein